MSTSLFHKIKYWFTIIYNNIITYLLYTIVQCCNMLHTISWWHKQSASIERNYAWLFNRFTQFTRGIQSAIANTLTIQYLNSLVIFIKVLKANSTVGKRIAIPIYSIRIICLPMKKTNSLNWKLLKEVKRRNWAMGRFN